MIVSKRLYRAAVFFSAGFFVACSQQSNDVKEFEQNAANTQVETTNSIIEPQLARANDNRGDWLSEIENSGAVDVAAIDAEIEKIRRDLIIDSYFESLYADQVNLEAIEDYYRKNKEQFTSEQVNIAHILIRTPAASSTEELAAAGTHAHELVSKLHTGADFAELARLESQDKTSAKIGGALDWVSPGQISDGVMKTAIAMEAGEVSEPIVEKYGIHIIKKLAPTRVREKPLSKVRAKISQKLRAEVKEQAIKNLTLAKK